MCEHTLYLYSPSEIQKNNPTSDHVQRPSQSSATLLPSAAWTLHSPVAIIIKMIILLLLLLLLSFSCCNCDQVITFFNIPESILLTKRPNIYKFVIPEGNEWANCLTFSGRARTPSASSSPATVFSEATMERFLSLATLKYLIVVNQSIFGFEYS